MSRIPAVHTVGGHQVLGADRGARTGVPIAHHRGDAVGVLFDPLQFRAIPRPAPAGAQVPEQDGFEPALRAVLHGRLRAQPVESGEDRVDGERRALLGAVQCRHDHHVGAGGRHRVHGIAHTQRAQDLQAAETEIARLRIAEDLAAALDHHRTDTVFGQQRRSRQAAGARSHNEHRGFYHVAMSVHRHLHAFTELISSV